MKLDRNTRIGGQSIKLVRDMLADIGRSDGFGIDSVAMHLQKDWWRATIDKMIKDGKLPHDLRRMFQREGMAEPRADNLWGSI